GLFEPWRVVETRRIRQGGRPDPLVGPLERSRAGSVDVEECPLRTMLQQLRVAPGTLVVAAAWQWTGVGLAMLATTAVFVAIAAYVWRRRGGSARAAPPPGRGGPPPWGRP